MAEFHRRMLALEFTDENMDELGAGLGFHLHESLQDANGLKREAQAFAGHFASAHGELQAGTAWEIYEWFFTTLHTRVLAMGIQNMALDEGRLFDFSHWTPEGDLVMLQFDLPH